MNSQMSLFLNGLDTSHFKELTESKFNKSDLIYFDENLSMLERMAIKFHPIIQEVAKRMTKHKEFSQPIVPLTKSSS